MSIPKVFPSGFQPQWFPYRESSLITNDGFTHELLLEGEMELPYPASRGQCWHVANEIAESCGYLASNVGKTGLLITGSMRQYLLVWSGPYVTSDLVDIIVDRDAIDHKMLQMRVDNEIDRLRDLLKACEGHDSVHSHVTDAFYSMVSVRRILKEELDNA